jgi:hypothetical protein
MKFLFSTVLLALSLAPVALVHAKVGSGNIGKGEKKASKNGGTFDKSA